MDTWEFESLLGRMTTTQPSPSETLFDLISALTDMRAAVNGYKANMIEEGWSPEAAEEVCKHLLITLHTKSFLTTDTKPLDKMQ